ncbi:MAG: hypothetical protein M3Y48_18130 [Actinomycetota bacterium]|nr:hypothetical protein [Actinomycetota bacterium]
MVASSAEFVVARAGQQRRTRIVTEAQVTDFAGVEPDAVHLRRRGA